MKKLLGKMQKNGLLAFVPADLLLALMSAIVSFAAVFIFDIHHTFYPGHNIFAPDFIFVGKEPYMIGVTLGTIFGFLVLKALMYVIMLEESESQNK